jgi:DNA-binding MarR family transcriptional regulator
VICGVFNKSVELVLAAIRGNHLISQEQIQGITNLSERSVRSALVYLKETGLIEETTDLTDARKKKYEEVKT